MGDGAVDKHKVLNGVIETAEKACSEIEHRAAATQPKGRSVPKISPYG